MEIGPGPHYGVPLILACYGALVLVADRFSPAWQPDFHPTFYSRLLERLVEESPLIDSRPLRTVQKNQNSLKDYVKEIKTPLEKIPRSLRCSCDAIFSNAVLEHLYQPLSAIRRMAFITRPGGLGLHQIDFRDHRDFNKPLEYLLLGQIQFWKVFHWSHGECGNRLRSGEFSSIFTRGGFSISSFECNKRAEAPYLDEFLPRLRAASSAYADCKEIELRTLSGQFELIKI